MGNEAYDLLNKRYLVDGFYGNTTLKDHFHNSGSGNLRGFIKNNKSKVDGLLSTTNEIIFSSIASDIKITPELKIFMDSGFFGKNN